MTPPQPPPPPKLSKLFPFALLVGFVGLCVLAILGHVDMKQSATATLVGMVLGGMMNMLDRIVRYYYRDDDHSDKEP